MDLEPLCLHCLRAELTRLNRSGASQHLFKVVLQGTTGMRNLTDLASRSLDEDAKELEFKELECQTTEIIVLSPILCLL